jgi:hypothetical protein
MTLEKSVQEKDLQGLKTREQYKSLFRNGVPDNKRRELILQLFDLTPMVCE